VEELKRIIEEIERMSVEVEPAIELYQLQHIQGEALSDIIAQVQSDVLSGHQGRVTILPLGKPNALLLIGWGETVKKAKELIAKLDQPVDPQSHQRVFSLRHASAATVSTTLMQFFATPFGLEPRVHITPDPRTNSLVVRAAPRDLAEIEMLLEKLDSPSSETVFRTRIFKLYNTWPMTSTPPCRVRSRPHEAAAPPRADRPVPALRSRRPWNCWRSTPTIRSGNVCCVSGILNDVRVTPDPRLNIFGDRRASGKHGTAGRADQGNSTRPEPSLRSRSFRIVNGDANTMSQMLRTLLPTQTGTTGPQLSVAEGEPSTMGIRFSTDTRTNAIIAIGSTGDLRIVEALIMRLDALDVQERKTIVVRLKNSPASDVANAVNKFLTSERRVEMAAAGTTSPFQQLEKEVVVVPETVSNSLIISATPRFFPGNQRPGRKTRCPATPGDDPGLDRRGYAERRG